ncbi:DUF6517 family protein [Natronococcus occultus]|uniref:Uncharacterized protein n=1 Tax=Natronococcus occultus SP4 TaxID=694430 RepID=L0JZL0_9EURY|nr:DUF6517 family protein [Natronococcus occultus]AGB37740.1 hypothetical protein Natoc_1950 [Natronococcus occultus SP4]
MKRRQIIAGAGTVGLASLAGCLGTVGLDSHEATPAGIEPEIREDAGYERTAVDELRLEETVDVSVLSEEIVLVNALTEYEKTLDLGLLGEHQGAEFVAFSSPQVELLGRGLNPIGERSTAELVDLVVTNYGGIGDVDHKTDEDVTVLGQSTTLSTFTGEAELGGRTVDVDVLVTETVAAGDDLVATLGVYPTTFENEGEHVRSLIGGVLEELPD